MDTQTLLQEPHSNNWYTMKHHPTCKTQQSCLVYHENDVCPDADKCTCDGNYSPLYSLDKYKDTMTQVNQLYEQGKIKHKVELV